MGQPRAELVREIIDALNRADVAGLLARVDSEFEWRTLESSPAAGIYRGHEEVRGYVEDWLATFEGLRIDVDEMTEAGDQVLAVVRGRARGRGSGIEVENRYCQVWTLQDGTAVDMQEYETREQALAGLGG
jgi:ketosteroid isomerase-like protein